jgi:hypothetical protein
MKLTEQEGPKSVLLVHSSVYAHSDVPQQFHRHGRNLANNTGGRQKNDNGFKSQEVKLNRGGRLVSNSP